MAFHSIRLLSYLTENKTNMHRHLLSVSSISATASLGSPKQTPRSDESEDSDKDKLKNSEPSLRQSGLITTFTVFSVSPGLNTTDIASLE